MKKFLSLVLALVMTMSLVTVSAGAKDFTDNSKINYEEAVEVMQLPTRTLLLPTSLLPTSLTALRRASSPVMLTAPSVPPTP